MVYYFVLGWPFSSEENRIQKENFELLKKNREKAPFSMMVYLVDLGKPRIVMSWQKPQPDYRVVIQNWLKSSGGVEYQDTDLVGPESFGLHLPPLNILLGFRGVIDGFRAKTEQ